MSRIGYKERRGSLHTVRGRNGRSDRARDDQPPVPVVRIGRRASNRAPRIAHPSPRAGAPRDRPTAGDAVRRLPLQAHGRDRLPKPRAGHRRCAHARCPRSRSRRSATGRGLVGRAAARRGGDEGARPRRGHPHHARHRRPAARDVCDAPRRQAGPSGCVEHGAARDGRHLSALRWLRCVGSDPRLAAARRSPVPVLPRAPARTAESARSPSADSCCPSGLRSATGRGATRSSVRPQRWVPTPTFSLEP